VAYVEQDARRPRTPRHEGRQNMLRATLELLAERHPDAITVRDIAERSGHNHRFVQEWFGGKTQLFAEAFHELSLEVADRLDFNRPDTQIPDPLVVRVIELMNWLVASDAQAVTGARMRPILNRLQHMYQDRFGIEGDTALLMAQRLMFLMSGVVLFKDVIGAGVGVDVPRQVLLEFEIARRLGTRPG
jgi:AcrR family transcriptional regulator